MLSGGIKIIKIDMILIKKVPRNYLERPTEKHLSLLNQKN